MFILWVIPILFRCTEYLSPVQTEVYCEWTHTLDPESPLIEQRLAIGERQLQDQIVPFEMVPYGEYNWKRSLDIDKLENKTRAFVTLQVCYNIKISPYMSDINVGLCPPCVLHNWNFLTLKVNYKPQLFTPQPLRAVGVLFSPMVSGWAGGRASCRRAAGKSLSGLYLRNRKVWEVDTW